MDTSFDQMPASSSPGSHSYSPAKAADQQALLDYDFTRGEPELQDTVSTHASQIVHAYVHSEYTSLKQQWVKIVEPQQFQSIMYHTNLQLERTVVQELDKWKIFSLKTLVQQNNSSSINTVCVRVCAHVYVCVAGECFCTLLHLIVLAK